MLLQRILPLLLLALAQSASASDAVSLSALSDALHKGDAPAVRALFLNQPVGEAEQTRFETRVAEIQLRRATRLGKAFFACLNNAPKVANLPALSDRAWLAVRWRLPEEGEISLNAAWVRREQRWLIESLSITLGGTGLAPFAAAAPYFGSSRVAAAVLDDPRLEALIPASELALEDGACATALADMRDALTGPNSREDKLAAIARHADDDQYLDAVRTADADSARRWALWDGLKREWELSKHWPTLSGAPRATGARVDCGYSGASVSGGAWASRLATGSLGVGGEAVPPPEPGPIKETRPAPPAEAPKTERPREEKRHDKTRKSN